jgi:hypothetical protein
MRIALALSLSLLLVLPNAIADNGKNAGDGSHGQNGNGDGHGQGDEHGQNATGEQKDKDHKDKAQKSCLQQRDDGPEHGREGPEGNGTSSQSIHLGSSPASAPTLNWTVQGLQDACGYKVYRSDLLGNTHVVAVLDQSSQTYTDTSASSGATYEYFVQAITRTGSGSVRSNSNFISVFGPCNWISVSPFGSPPVLFHPECLGGGVINARL